MDNFLLIFAYSLDSSHQNLDNETKIVFSSFLPKTAGLNKKIHMTFLFNLDA